MFFVYKIISKQTGKYYVGSSKNLEKRITQHKTLLKNNKHHCFPLQEAYNNNEEFTVEKIQCSFEKEMRLLEEAIINIEYNNIYNVSKNPLGGGSISYNSKTIELMSEEERKEKFGKIGSLNGMYGKTHTDEVKRKLSEFHKGNSYAKGYKWTTEQRKKLSEVAKQRTGNKNPFYGKHHNEETKRKIAESRKGKTPANAIKINIEGTVYNSMGEASRELNIPVPTILYRIKSKNKKFDKYTYV